MQQKVNNKRTWGLNFTINQHSPQFCFSDKERGHSLYAMWLERMKTGWGCYLALETGEHFNTSSQSNNGCRTTEMQSEAWPDSTSAKRSWSQDLLDLSFKVIWRAQSGRSKFCYNILDLLHEKNLQIIWNHIPQEKAANSWISEFWTVNMLRPNGVNARLFLLKLQQRNTIISY